MRRSKCSLAARIVLCGGKACLFGIAHKQGCQRRVQSCGLRRFAGERNKAPASVVRAFVVVDAVRRFGPSTSPELQSKLASPGVCGIGLSAAQHLCHVVQVCGVLIIVWLV